MGNSAKSVFFPVDKTGLSQLSEKYSGKDVLIEEKVGGHDVSVDCIRFNDFFQGSVYESLVTKTEGGGTTTQRQIVDNPKLVQYAKSILDKIGYDGVCGMDFRVDESNDRIAFIEVNARYTGGLATPIAAGFDIPSIHYALLTTGSYNGSIKIKSGTKTKWILGDLITLVGRTVSLHWKRSEMKKVLSFRGFDAFDDFRKDDKLAIWGEIYYYFKKLIVNRKLNP